jgi:hypothetical protein
MKWMRNNKPLSVPPFLFCVTNTCDVIWLQCHRGPRGSLTSSPDLPVPSRTLWQSAGIHHLMTEAHPSQVIWDHYLFILSLFVPMFLYLCCLCKWSFAIELGT